MNKNNFNTFEKKNEKKTKFRSTCIDVKTESDVFYDEYNMWIDKIKENFFIIKISFDTLIGY